MRVSFEGVVEASPWANVMWVDNGALLVPSAGELNNFAIAIYGFYRDTLLENLTATTVLQRCVVLYQEPNGDKLGAEHIGTDTGDFADQPYPANVSAAISWSIQQRYRGGHPRTYLPGIPSSQFADNTTLQASWITAVQNSANQFHQTVNAYASGTISSLLLGTVSFVRAKAWRSPPVFRSYVLNGAFVDSRIDSQRRRLGPDR